MTEAGQFAIILPDMDPELVAALAVFIPTLLGIAFILAIWLARDRIF